MATEDERKAIRIDCEVPPDFPSSYASNLVAQYTEHDFTITFFDVRPPLLMGTPAEKVSQLNAVDVVKATPIARIVVAASRMHEFVQVLSDNLQSYRTRAESENAPAPAGDKE